MVAIVWAQEAALWLEEIHNYIAEGNPQVARKVVASIYQKPQLHP
jgi:plasmid stabilization system protein ParE